MKVRYKFYKVLALFLSFIVLLSMFVGCADDHPELPDYTSRAKQYDFMGYSGPSNGEYERNGEKQILGPDLRTVEGYTTYKDCGFNIVMLSDTAGYDGEVEWEKSECKRAMTAAVNAGLDKIIINDRRINDLLERRASLVGANSPIKSEEELKEIVKGYLSTYINEKGFYGVILRDEPPNDFVKAFGWTYKAIKAAAKELGMDYIYIHMNLLPYDNVYSRFAEEGEYNNMADAYYGYVRSYIEATNADRVSCDVYAFRNLSIAGAFYTTAQVFSRLSKEYDFDVTFCLQSFAFKSNYFRRVGKSEMLYEIYSLMGFGFDNFAYFTYMPSRTSTNTQLESTFINEDGSLNNIYYYGQEAMANAQAMANYILNYEFIGSKFYMNTLPTFDVACFLTGPAAPVNVLKEDGTVESVTSSLNFDNTHEFALVKGVEFDNDVVYISELKDNENDLYMYMVQNVIRPSNSQYGRTTENVKVNFGVEYTYVAELKDGKLEYVELNNGVYEKTLSAGHAVYLIPLK